jgi:Domain of unknown function (DU1801)
MTAITAASGRRRNSSTSGGSFSKLASKQMITVSAQLKKVPAAVRPTVAAAVKAVREAAPQAQEIPYQMEAPRSERMMWKIVRFAVDGENVVGVGTFPRHSTIFFYRGRELDAGEGLLQGAGKDTRFVTLRAPGDVARPEIKRLIRKAFALTRA